MKTTEQIEAEIAALQAELEERKSEPDLSEAVEEYRYGAEFPHSPYDNVYRGLIAAHPSLERGRVWCRECGHTERVDGAKALRHGWPKCCGYTMTIDSPSEQQP